MGISPILLSGGIALVLGLGMVLGLGLLSLLSGAFNFLFVRPKLVFLKTRQGKNGLAFHFSWDNLGEPASFDGLTMDLFNPFGSPDRKEISCSFDPSTKDFTRDIDMGSGFSEILEAKGFDKARVMIGIKSNRDALSHYFEMTGQKLKRELQRAVEQGELAGTSASSKPLFQSPAREFIADPLGDVPEKVLKIPTNPQFAPDFLGTMGKGSEETSSLENFSVKKVWIDPGCIVCDACEGIYPEVFEVLDETCIIRDNAPLDNGLLIEEAAEACPVEVIKFQKA